MKKGKEKYLETLFISKEQLLVLMRFAFIDGHTGGLVLTRDYIRKALKNNVILKYSDIVKQFGTFTKFKSFIRKINY